MGNLMKEENADVKKRTNLGSPDSQYGFSSTPAVDGTPYTVLDPRTSSGIAACHPGIPTRADIAEGGFYSWGPPPPYASNRNSANNSPARRSLGEILHQVSPIRRNDNVSPARGLHHVHRHHIHHNRQCSSSSRQVQNSAQKPLDSVQKTTPLRATPITNAIQQQQAGMEPLWSNSLSSVHQFHKVIQNKTNYENMYDLQNILPTSGFNTLPSLKKRNQPRVSDIFQDETSTAYFFSSAENLGCSTSNIKMQSQSENLPSTVFLKSSQPNTSRYGPANSQNFTFKSQNDLSVSENSNQVGNPDKGSLGTGNKPLRSVDRNTSLVGKLFFNCSPSKQKSRNAQAYSFEREENIVQNPRKKINKKLEPKEIEVESNSENVITFHYRVGIPRSPDIQNFNQFLEKSPYSAGQEGTGNDFSLKDKKSDSDVSLVESQNVPKSTKYIMKDMELLQKHGSLIKEFNKNLDTQKKYRSSRVDMGRNTRIENENFNQTNDSREVQQNFQKTFHSDLRHTPSVSHVGLDSRPNFQTNDSVANEDYLLGNVKANENESDVYFGDISNSSCYMSLQNDGLDSLMYEDTSKERTSLPKYSNNGHAVLNKQNLKMMESESLVCNEVTQRYDGHSDNKQHSENFSYNKHQNVQEPVQQNCKHRGNRASSLYQSPDEQPEENCLEPSKEESRHEVMKKTSRRLMNNSRFSHAVQDPYRHSEHHQESITSNDEQSSGSLTADSGISTGRSFIPACFENSYHEIGPKGTEASRSVTDRAEIFKNKISDLDFSHPLFQKPKALPRGNRYKESEPRLKKKFEFEESESGNYGDLDSQNKRKRNFVSKPKSIETSEEVANQLLSTCNLTLTRDSDHFLEDDHFDILPKAQDNQLPIHEENFQVTVRKSPKPLPRTSVLNKSTGDNNDHNFGKTSQYLQESEKLGHYIAPDAQYEFQENFKGDSKPKTLNKSQNLAKNKPAVPARPHNLQIEHKKPGKVENLNVRIIRLENESGCPVPRRRQNVLEDSEGKENVEIGSHSVNV